MTPQEKADELHVGYWRLTNNARIAKECALVTVNEIIESREDDSAFDDTMWENASEYYSPHPMYLNYWLKVKIEIEKL
jgi:hypothetical protein